MDREKSKNNCPAALAERRGQAVEILHCRKRAPLGGNSGDVTGAGKPEPGAGGWHWHQEARSCRDRATGRCRKAGRSGSARPDRALQDKAVRQGPLHLIHGGGLVPFCPTQPFWPGPTRQNSPGRHPRVTTAGNDPRPAGSTADTRQPPAGVGHEVSLPPQAATRSRIPARPKPPPDRSRPHGWCRGAALTTSSATPVSWPRMVMSTGAPGACLSALVSASWTTR